MKLFWNIFRRLWLREHLGAGDGDEGGEEGEGLPPLEGLPRGTGLKYFQRQILSFFLFVNKQRLTENREDFTYS